MNWHFLSGIMYFHIVVVKFRNTYMRLSKNSKAWKTQCHTMIFALLIYVSICLALLILETGHGHADFCALEEIVDKQ